MRRSLKAVAVVAALTAAGVASAELAARYVEIVYKTNNVSALTVGAPSGSTNGTGGWSLNGDTLNGGTSVLGWQVAAVWCEVATNAAGTGVAKYNWWRQGQDAGWVMAPGLSETVIGLDGGQARVASLPIAMTGLGTSTNPSRVACQPIGVTEIGSGGDAGMRIQYGFRLERYQ